MRCHASDQTSTLHAPQLDRSPSAQMMSSNVARFSCGIQRRSEILQISACEKIKREFADFGWLPYVLHGIRNQGLGSRSVCEIGGPAVRYRVEMSI